MSRGEDPVPGGGRKQEWGRTTQAKRRGLGVLGGQGLRQDPRVSRKISSRRVSVLVCSGCYNKILWIGWLANNRNSCLRVLESRMRAPVWTAPGEGPLPGC